MIRASKITLGTNLTGIHGTGTRAHYAKISFNTAATPFHGYTLYDENFNHILNLGRINTVNQYGPPHLVILNDSTYCQGSQIMGAMGNFTATQQSASSSSFTLSGCTNTSQIGAGNMDIYSDGTCSVANHRSDGSAMTKMYGALNIINSDHTNKRILYILKSGVIKAFDKLYGSPHSASYPYPGTSSYTVTSLDSSMRGSASYHLNRKELVILSFVSSSGSYNIFHFANVDFDTYPDPNIALNRPEVVRTNSSLTIPNWSVNNAESYYNLKPVITDNGTIYVSVFFTSTAFRLYSVTRNGSNAVTAGLIATLSATTSYGIEQGDGYGQRQITSRDGTSVALFCPYYYYGCGVLCYMINKTNNTYTSYSNADASSGTMVLPFKDNGWAFYYAGNGYSSNYTGAYINTIFEKAYTGGFTNIMSTSGGKLFPYFTGPNTTNYPGLVQVTDYDLIQSNKHGAKL